MFLNINIQDAVLLWLLALSTGAAISNLWSARKLAAARRNLVRTKHELELTEKRMLQQKEMARNAGQTLACVCVQLDVAKKFKVRNPDEATAAVDRARNLAGDSLQIMRNLIAP